MQPRSFVLFLPANEMHELSLLYMNYFLRAKGERTIYLGQSVPHEDLRYLTGTAMRQHIFITVLTNSPSVPDVTALVNDLSGSLPAPHNSLWIAAQGAADTKITIPEGTRLFGSGLEVLGAIRAIDEAVS